MDKRKPDISSTNDLEIQFKTYPNPDCRNTHIPNKDKFLKVKDVESKT